MFVHKYELFGTYGIPMSMMITNEFRAIFTQRDCGYYEYDQVSVNLKEDLKRFRQIFPFKTINNLHIIKLADDTYRVMHLSYTNLFQGTLKQCTDFCRYQKGCCVKQTLIGRSITIKIDEQDVERLMDSDGYLANMVYRKFVLGLK